MTIREFANRVANAASYELGELNWGPAFEMTVEHIEQIMQQGQWRTKTQVEFSRWRECVGDAAMHMAQDGQLPRGAQLEKLSVMYYAN